MIAKHQLEIACFTADAALIAQQNGANRVELCGVMKVGGISPTIEIVKQVRANVSIDLYVMIRPRGGNFVYSDAEFLQMKTTILAFKELQVDGFVFGTLNENNQIDIEKNKELVELAHPLPCTFHRAFDEVSDVFQSLEDVIDCGFTTLLTSGQAQNVVDGVAVLSELVRKANNRIIIMPGGGLRSTNIEFIMKKTNALFYHSSAITDDSESPNPTEIKVLVSKLKPSS
ncbi:copper homeostasis protein CutC [Flavobacterium sp.]|uniref:copper homeostasis protein CutC n=1 Tax=Flavobacterium sp. TaxID=239 RepID=UPI002B4AB3FA|nr:copper homeostasis protein CutC [Flavobacterium sp.]HLP65648.1 copper homeostasis protein CutC [Flavobacterium sp.]